jgi:hypothetical protein
VDVWIAIFRRYDADITCNECGQVGGNDQDGILNDLVTPALATDMDKLIPDANHINALPGPLRKYIHDL